MRKLYTWTFFCALLGVSYTYSDTTTSRLGLTLPTIGSPTWGQKINTNFQILDATSTVVSGSLIVSTVSVPGGVTVVISSQAAGIAFDGSQFSASLLAGNTAQITIKAVPNLVTTTGTISGQLNMLAGSTLSVNGLFTMPTTSTFSATALSSTLGAAGGTTSINGATVALGSAGSTVTVTNAMTVNNILTMPVSSTFTFSGAGTISSMTATNYQGTASTITRLNVTGAMDVGGNKITSISSGTISSDATRYSQNKLLKHYFFNITGSTGTTSNNFATTSLTITTDAPVSTASRFHLQMAGTLTGSNPATAACELGFSRNGSNLNSTHGIAGLAGPTGSTDVPVSMSWTDSPSTLSAVTYAVLIRATGGVTCTLGADGQETEIEVDEINGL